jgi:hypothetical protein
MAYFVTYYTLTGDCTPSLPTNLVLRQTHPIDWAANSTVDKNGLERVKYVLFWKEVPDYFLDKQDIIERFEIEE